MTMTLRVLLTIAAFWYSASSAQDYGSMPLPELRALVSSFGERDGETKEFVSAAFESKRMDLLKMVFEAPATAPYFFGRFGEMPDSEFSRSVVLMVLRTHSPAWPDTLLRLSGKEYLNIVLDLHPLLQRQLPSLDWQTLSNTLSNREKRLKLADAYEAAITANSQTKAGATANQVTAPQPSSTKKPPALVEESPHSSDVGAMPESGQPFTPSDLNTEAESKVDLGFWAVLGIAAGVFGFWLAFRKRQ